MQYIKMCIRDSRLFRKIYEDNVSGKLNDERFYKLSDGYEAEQGQLKREIEAQKESVSRERKDRCKHRRRDTGKSVSQSNGVTRSEQK